MSDQTNAYNANKKHNGNICIEYKQSQQAKLVVSKKKKKESFCRISNQAHNVESIQSYFSQWDRFGVYNGQTESFTAQHQSGAACPKPLICFFIIFYSFLLNSY